MDGDEKGKYLIAITGDLGSGKTTVCRLLATQLNANIYSAGSIQRKMAADRGMSIVDFNKYMEQHPELDHLIDDTMAGLGKKTDENILLDSRLAWHFAPRSFSVYLVTEPVEAARRIAAAARADEHYDGATEALEKLKARRASEQLRYSTIYGLDIKNFSQFDLVLDTTTISPEEVARVIVESYEKHRLGTAYEKVLLAKCRLKLLPNCTEDGAMTVLECDDEYYLLTGAALYRKALLTNEENVSVTPIAGGINALYNGIDKREYINNALKKR